MTLADAYAIQLAKIRARLDDGARVSGHKVGLTSKAMQQMLGVDEPDYRLLREPQYDDEKVAILVEVEGAGDFLPPYSGNLDIMTAAAARVGEELAAAALVREQAA